MSELPKLLLKAFRSLSDEEQETVMTELLEARSAPWPWAGPAPARSPADLTVGLGPDITPPPLGPEGGGPWQSVPVRLSTEQHERLKQWCQANGFTMAVVLRGLVARFLDDQAARRGSPGGARGRSRGPEGAGPPASGPQPA
jgi:hypothetical protein